MLSEKELMSQLNKLLISTRIMLG